MTSKFFGTTFSDLVYSTQVCNTYQISTIKQLGVSMYNLIDSCIIIPNIVSPLNNCKVLIAFDVILLPYM